MINEISGRKWSSRFWIRASCPKERIKLWKERFEGLLGQPHVVDDQPNTRVFDVLPIKTEVDLAVVVLWFQLPALGVLSAVGGFD